MSIERPRTHKIKCNTCEAICLYTQEEFEKTSDDVIDCINCGSGIKKYHVSIKCLMCGIYCMDIKHHVCKPKFAPPPMPKSQCLRGKTPFHLLDLDFAVDMCVNYAEGVKDGRKENGWKDMKWTPEIEAEYKAKILRHLHGFEKTHDVKNLAAIACNANIISYHTKKQREQ